MITLADGAATGASYQFNGTDGWNYSGVSVFSAGDVGGDGKDDLIVGAPGANPGGIRCLILSADLALYDSSDGVTEGPEILSVDRQTHTAVGIEACVRARVQGRIDLEAESQVTPVDAGGVRGGCTERTVGQGQIAVLVVAEEGSAVVGSGAVPVEVTNAQRRSGRGALRCVVVDIDRAPVAQARVCGKGTSKL
ncbi:MAG: hypothetical protein GY926_19690, partial [bacterium]|nr:hypothetical protein [bacterium]